MDTTANPISNSVYRERLQQAKRVMEGLTEQQRSNNFDINRFASESEFGVIACIAGHCGLDPWFQAQGFETDIKDSNVNILPEDFFGTMKPFYRSYYQTEHVTVDDAICALDRAIDSLTDVPSISVDPAT